MLFFSKEKEWDNVHKFHGVVVSTEDFKSLSLSSILSGTILFYLYIIKKINYDQLYRCINYEQFKLNHSGFYSTPVYVALLLLKGEVSLINGVRPLTGAAGFMLLLFITTPTGS